MRAILTRPSHIFYRLAGCFFLFTGVILNEWTLAQLFSQDGNLASYSRFIIWVLDLLLIFGGFVLILQQDGRLLSWMGVGAVSVVTIAILAGYIIRMGYSFQIDYNEGWNVYHGIDAISGHALYADNQTMTPINYPPISLFVAGSLGQILHNPLLAGRLISLVSMFVTCLACGGIVRGLGGGLLDACFGGFFYLGLLEAYARGYIAMHDPQMLGHALMTIGLLVYVKDKSKWMPVAVLFCLALFTKHNLLPIPLAVFLDILQRSRREFFKWALVILVISGILLILITLALGSGFIDHMKASRGYDPQLIITWLTRLGPGLLIILVMTIPWLTTTVSNKQSRVIPFYLVFSLLFGLYTAGGIGTDINVFFDFFIGLSIAAGMSLWYLRTRFEIFDRRTLLISILLPLAMSFGILVRSPRRIPVRETFYMYNQMEQTFREDSEYLASKPGPVICSNILLCYVAGQNFVYDPFLVTEGMFSGRYQEADVLKQLEAGYYPVVQLNYPLTEDYLKELPYTSTRRAEIGYTENFLRALGKYYILTRETGTGAFYEPRQ